MANKLKISERKIKRAIDSIQTKEEKVSRLILYYLRNNPDAGDTLEGITKWWLEIERIELTVDEIVDVLNGLRKKGLIRMHKTSEGTTFYRISKETE